MFIELLSIGRKCIPKPRQRVFIYIWWPSFTTSSQPSSSSSSCLRAQPHNLRHLLAAVGNTWPAQQRVFMNETDLMNERSSNPFKFYLDSHSLATHLNHIPGLCCWRCSLEPLWPQTPGLPTARSPKSHTRNVRGVRFSSGDHFQKNWRRRTCLQPIYRIPCTHCPITRMANIMFV